ncbi:hypothetical protein PTQ19_03375 [Microbacterium esteraromaticum]|uniref:hypothetical protein n=1 Tax=Microbacterium esteraromaticum TaxID=57043 RepID=UPI00236812A3|nr:hypothetical protein [Microbacterium esteraromaticum]WDH79496.1 hypothetical protein PTQ19_03375 [Microbacterium esteraromaticum]
MNSLMLHRQLSEALVPLGTAGAVLATVSALIVCVMLAVRSHELGIPIAAWLAGTILSLAAGFSDLTPLIVSGSSGVAMLAFMLVTAVRGRTRRSATSSR